MRRLILFYSLGGSTRKWAAEQTDAEAVEVKETHTRNPFTAFLPGCPQALRRKASAIRPLSVDFAKYDLVELAAPIWAGYPAPAFNAMLALLPKGTRVRLTLRSSGGESPKSKSGTIALCEARGLVVESYRDEKSQ